MNIDVMAAFLGKILNVDVELGLFELKPVKGEYTNGFVKDDVIYLNELWLKVADEYDIYLLISHEARHLFQKAIVNGKVESKYISPEIRALWKSELDNYMSPTGDEMLDKAYFTQAIEIDAVAFSSMLMERLFGVTASPSKNIKTLVNMRKKEIEAEMDDMLSILG